MAEYVIDVRHVDKIYTTGDIKTQVLFDINLEVEKGSFNSIIGASGSGKTTLLNILGTLDKPSAGEVLIGGVRADQMTKNQLAILRNETIGFIFQFHYLLPEFTALENILLPVTIRKGRPDIGDIQRAEQLAELMGITGVKDNLATNMSGGQQQRTAVARALINEPKIVLADEPTGNLDSESSANIYSRFRYINETLGTTFIIVTHDRRIAEQTDRIIGVKDGRLDMDVRK
ncbi:MAG TPA: ABC transporter ATP-binding protein [Methanomassiliicoccales archaeon]|nr:ABC transporter ATP-binding protein [Methanomassiliicoccales archaeon]